MVYLNDVDYTGEEKRNRVILDLYSRKNRNYDLELCVLSSAPRIAWCLLKTVLFTTMMLYLHYVRWILKDVKLFCNEFQTEFLKFLTITLTSKHLHVLEHSESAAKERIYMNTFL